MKEIIIVFIGSGLGGITRFGLSKWLDQTFNHHFPFATFVVNLTACFILGFSLGLALSKPTIISPTTKLFLTIGFCGGFSTFSTFSRETLTLFQQGQHLSLVLYVFGSILICAASTFLGLFIAQKI
jgi:CrcB protein